MELPKVGAVLRVLPVVVVFAAGALAQEGVPQKSGKGIGPVKELKLGPVQPALVKKGKAQFDAKCTACHKLEQRYVGPPLKGVTQKREPEWIMNMMLNSAEMIQMDPTAKALFEEYLTPMPNQNITQEDARAILDYLRSVDGAVTAKKKSGSKK